MKKMKKSDRRKLFGILALVLILGLSLWAGWLLREPVAKILSEPEKIRSWVDSHGLWGQILFVLVTIAQILVALIPGEPLELMAGYAFGTVRGSLLCLGAATAGSLLVFWLVRRYGVRVVKIFYPPEKLQSLRFLKSSPKRTLLFTIVFLLPGTPKDLLCYYAGLTDMKLTSFALICSLGRIPSVISSTMGGNALGTEQYIQAVVVLVIALGISGIGMLIYHYICKKHNTEAQ